MMYEDVAAQIHEASMELLWDPGVRLEHDSVRDAAIRAGAKSGRGPEDVRFPREMVEERMGLCPREVVLAGRQGRETRLTARAGPQFWSVPALYFSRRGERRPVTSVDLARVTRLLHHLSEVDVVFGTSLDDVPPRARDVVGLEVMAEHTSKHIRVLCFSPESMDRILEMKRCVGAFPWFSLGFTAHGPLRWTRLALEIFRRSAGYAIPITVNGEPMAGTSGPVTLAGSAAVGNAEILAGIVVNQILEPGRPCIYNLGLAHILDMRTGVAVTGGPENALFARASGAMGRHYGIPSASWVSTEAMTPDSQAAMEKMFGFHTHMESGVTCIWGVGQLESEMTFSPAQAIIDNEIVRYATRYQRGIDVTPDSLALDVIRSVGIAGSFLEHDHTLSRFRSELFEPAVLFRRKREAWDAGGRQRLDERAEDLADAAMDRPTPNGLNEDQLRCLRGLASECAARCT